METTVDIEIDPVALIAAMGRHARSAALVLAGLSSADKARALEKMAQAIRDAEPDILAANKIDMANGAAAGLSAAMLDRLKLTPERVAATADGVATVATLKDPVGETIDEIERPNGLKLARVRVPIGVIGIIYESRPNVTADAAALCIGSGNAVILRGGSEAIESNRAIHDALVRGLEAAGVPGEAVQLVPVTDRAAARGWSRASRPRRGCRCSRISTGSTTSMSTPRPIRRWPRISSSTPRCAAPACAARWRRC
jgi:glutamate-5-semialdehyde dehydrogenase